MSAPARAPAVEAPGIHEEERAAPLAEPAWRPAEVLVGFSTPRAWNPLSALIRRMTGSEVSHTWLLVEDPAFQLRLVLEAGSSGFRLVSFTQFVKDNRVLALVKTALPLGGALPAAGGWLGKSFDLLGLFGIFLTLVARWFAQRPWRNPFPTPSALFCSEAVVKVLKEARYPGAEGLADEGTTPAALLAFLREDPRNVEIDGGALKLWGHLTALRKARRREERAERRRTRGRAEAASR